MGLEPFGFVRQVCIGKGPAQLKTSALPANSVGAQFRRPSFCWVVNQADKDTVFSADLRVPFLAPPVRLPEVAGPAALPLAPC
jgi:hypothetical protein